MATRLRFDRCDNVGIPVAEGGNADTRDEIKIAAAVSREQPTSFGARDFKRDRRVRGLREAPAKQVAQFAHRTPTIASSNAPPPCRHSSGGDCISPNFATYE